MQTYQSKKQKIIIFQAANEILAIDIEDVLEVINKPILSPIPKNYDFIEGLINFRGDIITVINIKKLKNNIELAEIQQSNVLIIKAEIGEENLKIGLKVDKIIDIINIKESDIKQVPELGKNFDNENYTGSFKYKNGFILILNPEKIF